jgi:hypothetical protein
MMIGAETTTLPRSTNNAYTAFISSPLAPLSATSLEAGERDNLGSLVIGDVESASGTLFGYHFFKLEAH